MEETISGEELETIIEEFQEVIIDDEDTCGSCWGVRIEKENKKIIFLMDKKKIFSMKLPKREIPYDECVEYLHLLENGEFEILKQKVKSK